MPEETEAIIIEEKELFIEEDNSTPDFFKDYSYTFVPKIPEEERGADIIGLRTRSTGSIKVKLGPIQPKKKLRQIWSDMTDVEKYILMLISEHRHLTLFQLKILVVNPTNIRQSEGGGQNVMKTYFRWVTETKYEYHLDYKETHKTASTRGLTLKINRLKEIGVIEEIVPSYDVKSSAPDRYKETPSLFNKHYYLTALGAKVLICNTAVRTPATTTGKKVGFVETYKNAAYMSIVHETESTEVFCSLISCAEYASNLPDDKEHPNYGFFDICRFYHEKDVEEKSIVYKGKKIDFKPDGKLTMYVSKLGDFIDYYLEYDSGSSTSDKIKHKLEAFIKYIFHKRAEFGERFRKPVLLLVTQKPSDFIPAMNRKKQTAYTRGIASMTKTYFSEYGDAINDIATVAVADCNSIRRHGALGACWHKIDLTTGVADTQAVDLIEVSKGVTT